MSYEKKDDFELDPIPERDEAKQVSEREPKTSTNLVKVVLGNTIRTRRRPCLTEAQQYFIASVLRRSLTYVDDDLHPTCQESMESGTARLGKKHSK